MNDQGYLLVGVCHDMPVHEFIVSVRGNGSDWVDVTHGLGARDMRAGDVIEISALGAPEFDYLTFKETVFQHGIQISVNVYEAAGEMAETAWGVFKVPREGLQPGVWLFPDGSRSDRVCGSYEQQSGKKIGPDSSEG